MEIDDLRSLQGELADLGLPDLRVKEIQFFILEISRTDDGSTNYPMRLLKDYRFESIDSKEEILKEINKRKVRMKLQDFFCEEGKKKCRGKVGFSTFIHLMNMVKIPVGPEPQKIVVFGFRTKNKLIASKIYEFCYRTQSPSWILMSLDQKIHIDVALELQNLPFFDLKVEKNAEPEL
jgi:hypothetical protein